MKKGNISHKCCTFNNYYLHACTFLSYKHRATHSCTTFGNHMMNESAPRHLAS
ncbi:hypothetical protein HanIR_Chr02g0060011 [Helianthus annuus]|nr:hypothetical protein HanIR_Chr02g0060011 [Helianthus annuus]